MEIENKKEFDFNSIKKSTDEIFFTFEGVEYSIIPMTVQEEAENEDLYRINGKASSVLTTIFVLVKLNKVPFEVEHIEQTINVRKDWLDLTFKQRFNFLKTLDSGYLNGLIKAVHKTQEPQDKALGNS